MSASIYKTVSIPAAIGGAPGVVSQEVSGSVFYCVTSSGEFVVRVADQGPQTMSSGRWFGTPGGRGFGALTFENTSGSVVTVTFWVGWENFIDPTVQLKSDLQLNVTLSNVMDQTTAATSNIFSRTVPSPGTPITITPIEEVYIRKAIVYALKDTDGTPNAGNVQIGPAETTLPIILSPGDEYVIEPPLGTKTDLFAWYIDAANADDGVVIIYW